jgi:serine/threonine-protein kinase
MIGKTLSHYRVVEKIGAGGMGEVYRATDTRLNRDVALKVLPEEFARDADRMARFKREAQVLASLNHPNIAAIYGLEEDQGKRALVLELVEGPTLAERIAQGALPLEEALNIARQIAQALEAAHEKGIIHRDLKPANVKVKKDGSVKVLDFGLAKALESPQSEADIANSPTLSLAATQAGVILGTAAYMSPEQARGEEADRRADIWSFGVVLYEMLTGQRLFTGRTASDVLAAVLRAEADWDSLPQDTPRSIRQLLRRCLTRDHKQRLQAIGDARIEIEEYLADPAAASLLISTPTVAPQPLWQRALPWVAAGVMTFVALLQWAPWGAEVAPTPGVLTRFSVEFPGLDSIQRGPCCGGPLGISPDGKRLAFTAFSGGKNQIYLRAMDQTVAVPLAGTQNSTSPFFSPDGQWIGFFSDGKLKKISVEGGAPLTLCDIGSADIRGAAWGPEDTIAFAGTGSAGLSVVSGEGGIPAPLTVLDTTKGEVAHRWPSFLPNGKAVLFTVVDGEGLHVETLLLESGERRRLISHGANPLYADSGHLVYAQFEGADGSAPSGVILAVPFDPLRVEVTGSLVPVLEGVSVFSGGKANLTVSQNGSLVYLPGGGGGENRLVWFDRAGNRELLPETGRIFETPRISPDGKMLAVTVLDGAGTNLWSYDFRRETFSRLTFDPGAKSPVWRSDGSSIAFANPSRKQLLWVAADGTRPPEELLTGESPVYPYSFSDDGKTLTYIETAPLPNIHALNLEGKPEQEAVLPDTFRNFDPALSPDGRWLAYASSESGQSDIYVREFPGPGGKWQISNGGGEDVAWSHDGRELFYLNGSQMMLVTVETEPQFSSSRPSVLFVGDFPTVLGGRNYDISPDGKRFLIVQRTASAANETPTPTLEVIINWFEELRRRVPTRKN